MEERDISKMTTEELLEYAFEVMKSADKILDRLEFRCTQIERDHIYNEEGLIVHHKNSMFPPGAEIKVLKWPKL